MDKLKPLDRETVGEIARDAVDQAQDFIESEIQESRLTSQRYYDGEVDIGEEEGLSKVVATKVRDSIRGAIPSLMRVFLATDRPVEFVPPSPMQAEMAETATRYVNNLFNRSKGYQALHDCILDACVKKVGIAKAYWDTYEEAEDITYTNLTTDEATLLLQEPDVEVLDSEEDEYGYSSLKVQYKSTSGCLKIESVPPEDFFIDESATCIDDAYVCGQQSEVRVTDLVEMGFDFEEVADLGSVQNEDENDIEAYERKGYQESEASGQDPSMNWVTVTECYMKVDMEGTGIARLHKIILGGKQYKVLDVEPVDHIPYAAFQIDPVPHTFFGTSMAENLFHEQDVATTMLRSMCDNVALTNHPRLEVDDAVVNMDDLLNNEIGGVIRSQRAGQSIFPMAVPFTAGQTLGAMQYLDQQIEGKVGVYSASNGLHPDALQSQTAAAVQATVQASAGQLEVYARNLAEGGMADLFKIILKLAAQNSVEEEYMQMGANVVPIDPRSWNLEMQLTVNVGLGTGKEDQKTSALMKALDIQQQVVSAYGPANGIVSIENIRNTIADMLAMNGIRNIDRYFPPITQMPQPQQQGSDPNEAFVQAEAQKAQIKEQGATMRKQMELQAEERDRMMEAAKFTQEDDFKRDELDQELLIAAAEILGKWGSSVDIERIKAMQNAQRGPMQ